MPYGSPRRDDDLFSIFPVGLLLTLGQFQLAAFMVRSDLAAAFERTQRDLTAGSAWISKQLADDGVS